MSHPSEAATAEDGVADGRPCTRAARRAEPSAAARVGREAEAGARSELLLNEWGGLERALDVPPELEAACRTECPCGAEFGACSEALCAAFGTTSAAPMLHVAGITPEAALPPKPLADRANVSLRDLSGAWHELNSGPEDIGLVAIGSPHASANECREFARLLNGRPVRPTTIVTAGRSIIRTLNVDGTLKLLEQSGVQVIPDLCWCSITEPVFPADARTIMTNSGKYAHYGPGLSGRAMRLGSLADCASAALSGTASKSLPEWLSVSRGSIHA